ncbi:MAG: alpha/beta hydrolase, partial [Actinomycetota bacterium]
MRRALAGVAVLVLVVVGLVIAGRDTPVEEVSLTVEVSSPEGDPSVTLDAGLYQADGATLPAPALLLAHGFGSDRSSLDEAARAWAREGYVVLTWSARGFGASGGSIGLNDPDREIADVSVLVDLLASRLATHLSVGAGPDHSRRRLVRKVTRRIEAAKHKLVRSKFRTVDYLRVNFLVCTAL